MESVQVASIDTLHVRGVRSKAMPLPPANLLIFDEAHRKAVLEAQPRQYSGGSVNERNPIGVLIGGLSLPPRAPACRRSAGRREGEMQSWPRCRGASPATRSLGRGCRALTGAADAIVILKRYSGMVKVHVRGRDIEEAEFAAEFNKDTCRWRLVGEADEVFRSQQRQAIATALKEAKRPMSVPEIMAATERRDRHATEVLLIRMEKAGEVRHVGRGQWAHPDTTRPPTESGDIGDKVTSGKQAFGSSEETDASKSHCNVTASEASDICSDISEPTNPLNFNGRGRESHYVTNVTGSYRADDPGPFPDCLRRSPSLSASSSAVR
jgi:hypothetical protein